MTAEWERSYRLHCLFMSRLGNNRLQRMISARLAVIRSWKSYSYLSVWTTNPTQKCICIHQLIRKQWLSVPVLVFQTLPWRRGDRRTGRSACPWCCGRGLWPRCIIFSWKPSWRLRSGPWSKKPCVCTMTMYHLTSTNSSQKGLNLFQFSTPSEIYSWIWIMLVFMKFEYFQIVFFPSCLDFGSDEELLSWFWWSLLCSSWPTTPREHTNRQEFWSLF